MAVIARTPVPRLDSVRRSRAWRLVSVPSLRASGSGPRSAAVLLAAVLLAAVPSGGAAGTGTGSGEKEGEPGGPVAHLIERDGRPQVEARLLFSHQDPRRVGVLFDLAPGWHVYWRSAGDTGLPPELSFEVEGGITGPIRWPVPEAFTAGGSERGAASYGYEERVLLASELRLAPGGGRTHVAVEGDVLVCEYECVPALFRLERTLGSPVPGLTPEAEDALFERFAARVPEMPSVYGLELSAAWSQSAVRPGDAFEGVIALRSCTGDGACNVHAPDRTRDAAAVFFPDDRETVLFRVRGVRPDATDPRLQWIELSGRADPDEPIDFDRLTGVLSLRDEAGRERAVEVDLPFPTAEAGAEVVMLGAHWYEGTPASPSAWAVLRALFLALVGGLVLNLMPCVLPVLAIKVFSISEMAQAARDERSEPVRHGLAYTAGILASMALLGACVVTLRAAGRSVGWGFQFQEPFYVAGVSAVLVAFALNLFGIWEIRVGAGRLASLGQEATGARRSFFEGLLAVALATPCSAPFLGTAVGFAFASSAPVILGIFLAIGLGLAAPFLLVSLVPAWARFVPRSGAWMQLVRSGLGFVLLATVLWLLWIFGGSAGSDGVVTLLGFLLALAFGLWLFGRLQEVGRPRATLIAGATVVLLAASGLNAVGTRSAPGSGAGTSRVVHEASTDGWQTWSPDAVDEQLAAGRPVFVRFTADWCITCKVNERVALADPEVREAFAANDFALLVGDWTQRDDAIRRELSRHGRAGVPLYLLYRPSRPDTPELLPELLSPDRVLAAIRATTDTGQGQGGRSLKTAAKVGR